jgi:hypothetical protein
MNRASTDHNGIDRSPQETHDEAVWARNEIRRRRHLEKTQRLPFDPHARAKLESWFFALADELDELEAEEFYPDGPRGKRKRFREEAEHYFGRQKKV